MKSVILSLAISSSLFATDNTAKMEALLNKSYQKYQLEKFGTSSLWLEAKHCVNEKKALKEQDATNRSIKQLVKACELLTEAAIADMETRQYKSTQDSLQKERIAVLEEMDQVRASITNLQKGVASRLQQAMEAEKAKLVAEQEENARLAAETTRLEAEIDAAEMAQAEAADKLDGLQSELISVKKDKRGIILSMSDILFKSGKAYLTPGLKTNLARISGILSVYKTSNILVEGHTDNRGSESYNQKLSEKRAKNVMDFMKEQGLDEKRLTSKGLGFAIPIADNSTKKGRAKNRRVDLVISDQKLQKKAECAECDEPSAQTEKKTPAKKEATTNSEWN